MPLLLCEMLERKPGANEYNAKWKENLTWNSRVAKGSPEEDFQETHYAAVTDPRTISNNLEFQWAGIYHSRKKRMRNYCHLILVKSA